MSTLPESKYWGNIELIVWPPQSEEIPLLPDRLHALNATDQELFYTSSIDPVTENGFGPHTSNAYTPNLEEFTRSELLGPALSTRDRLDPFIFVNKRACGKFQK